MEIKLKLLDKDLQTPKPAHDGDAGCDLFSRIDVDIKPGERVLVPTGIALSIPGGYAGFVQPRSGLAIKHGLSILNTPGLIDSKYRGEICVIAINTDKKETFAVKKGDKICQLVIQKVETPSFKVVSELDSTIRGSNGFGSTGI
ncbi:dUTP diphosphatase [Candidatus Oleimmundimicrobium sp.]|uniref:dUTP diphosphatase n=1 Tax=Candidatus Oleimmundimicrobium sp. TaxID=3060597 RepID=UPI002720AB4E|nr:dUTP diphosphatase [Candidatus Oleimmundimicrobium sp.]MDO8885398.1 dUTP diphosphatase [Candidatus Oleimmundimicrobium sp.]